MSEKRVHPYPDPPMKREKLVTETYEYHMPFNYQNVTVSRRFFHGAEFHGVEMNPVNSVRDRPGRPFPPDTIEIVEDAPIVRVVVIGSACQPPGFIQLEAEPTEEFFRPLDVRGVMPVRYRIGNLWGMHLRADAWSAQVDGTVLDGIGHPYLPIPEARKELWAHQQVEVDGGDPHKDTGALARARRQKAMMQMKSHYRENPLAGMSCAIFEIPKSLKIRITGGSDLYPWTEDNYPGDIHYSFRIIRTTILTSPDMG